MASSCSRFGSRFRIHEMSTVTSWRVPLMSSVQSLTVLSIEHTRPLRWLQSTVPAMLKSFASAGLAGRSKSAAKPAADKIASDRRIENITEPVSFVCLTGTHVAAQWTTGYQVGIHATDQHSDLSSDPIVTTL